MIVVCHGLTGGSHESYVRNILAVAVRPVKESGLGLKAVVVNVSFLFTVSNLFILHHQSSSSLSFIHPSLVPVPFYS